jgi:hypothetical protein
MRVFLDANILFSAAKSDGAVRQLLHLIVDGGHECWVDDYVVVEARRNLGTKGPDALGAFESLLATLHVGSVRAIDATKQEVNWLPEKDRPVLAAAIHLGCGVLVTGDRTHFGVGYGKAFGGVTIHSPRSLAESLSGLGWCGK